MKHSIEQFLNTYETLTPTDTLLGEAVANADWWKYVKPLFDDVAWMNFGERIVFCNNRFPYDNDSLSYSNIIRTFVTTLKANARNFERLYNVYMMDYNPLWNVDGVTGLITQDTHTGTDTRALTGTDTSVLSGTDRNTASGSDSVTNSGSDINTLSGSDSHSHTITKDDTTRSGYELREKDGDDTITHSEATFDSGSNMVDSTEDNTHYNNDEKLTYNNVKDAHEMIESNSDTYGKINTLAHGHVQTTQHGKTDTMTYGKQDQMTHNTLDTETRNLTDEHIELNVRQGNIGVTMSQQLFGAEWTQWSNNMNNFIMFVVRTCINKVSYACEGV